MITAVVDLAIAPLPTGMSGAERSAATRDLLRTAAADRAGVPAGEIEVVAHCPACGGAHGRPELVRGGRPLGLHASASRSGPWAAVAVADAPVGVDIEQVGRVTFGGFDAVALTGAEQAAVRALPAGTRDEARAGLWTAKEALLKVSGVGLRIAPSDVQLGLGWDRTVVDDPAQPGRPVGLAAVDVAGTPGYRLAVALAGVRPPAVRTDLSRAVAAPPSRTATR